MFRHPARSVGSYRSGPTAARTIGTKSTGGFYHTELSPCTTLTAHDGPGGRSDGVWEPLEGEPGPVGAVLHDLRVAEVGVVRPPPRHGLAADHHDPGYAVH